MTTGPRSFKASVTPKAAPGEVLPGTQFFDGTAWPGPEFKVMEKSYTAAAKTLPASGPARRSPWPATVKYSDRPDTRFPFPKFTRTPLTAAEKDWIGAEVEFRRSAAIFDPNLRGAGAGEPSGSTEARRGTVISAAPGPRMWWVLDHEDRRMYRLGDASLFRKGVGVGDMVKRSLFA